MCYHQSMRWWFLHLAGLLFWVNFLGCSDGNLYPLKGAESYAGGEIGLNSIPSDNLDTLTNSGADTETPAEDTATDSSESPGDEYGNDGDVSVHIDEELNWIVISGGTFEMGSTLAADEQPVHVVSVPTFEMLQTEVTVAQMKTVPPGESYVVEAYLAMRMTSVPPVSTGAVPPAIVTTEVFDAQGDEEGVRSRLNSLIKGERLVRNVGR